MEQVITNPLGHDLTVANGAALYAAGDQVGAVMQVSATTPQNSGNDGPIAVTMSLAAVDVDNQKAAFDLLFFRTSIVDVGDNNAFAPSAADAQKFIGSIKVTATDWTTYGARALVTKAATMLASKIQSGVIYAVMVNQGAPTYATASGLRIKLAGVVN